MITRHCIRLFLLGLVLLSGISSGHSKEHGQGARVGVVISGDAYYFTLTYQQMTEQVLAELPDTRFVLLSPASLKRLGHDPDLDLLVAIGSEAARNALQHRSIDTPLLATFVTEEAFRHHLDHAGEPQAGRRISAVYLDQPAAYRFRLARRLLPEAQVLGTALGPLAGQYRHDYLASAAQLQFQLMAIPISLTSNPDRELTPVFRQADVFVVAPDSPQPNQAAARWILNLGYRNRTPVIGFSRSYTRAGALASLYTAPEDIGRHTGEAIAAWLCCQREDIWTPSHSRYFTIDTNASVAHALGMNLPSEAELYRALSDQEGEP